MKLHPIKSGDEMWREIERNARGRFVWWWLLPLGIAATGVLVAYVDLHGPWDGSDPNMSPRQAVDSGQAMTLE